MNDHEPGGRTTLDDQNCDLSLQEAAQLYDVSLRTLGNRVRWGEIDAYKARGPWGQEWRVTRKALESFGYRRREAPEPTSDPRTAELERELAAARRAAAAERNRADEADRRLGAALLEVGRLRAALAAALVVPSPRTLDLTERLPPGPQHPRGSGSTADSPNALVGDISPASGPPR